MSKLLVRIDGVSRGELGGALIGVNIRDAASGEIVARRSEVLDEPCTTDVQARYAALIEALELVHDADAEEIVFMTDSPGFRAELLGTAPPSAGCEVLHRVTVRALDWALAKRWVINWVPVGR